MGRVAVSASRVGVVLIAAFIGVLSAIGCVMAALFERDGFGRPRDSQPRTWYFALVAVGLVLSVVAPIGIAAWAFPARRRMVPAAAIVVVLGAVVFFGFARS